MTGPEHYQHAEMLLDLASEDETGSDEERFHLAKAQAHATLAAVYAYNRATTELTGLLRAMLDEARERHEAALEPAAPPPADPLCCALGPTILGDPLCLFATGHTGGHSWEGEVTP